MGEQGRSDRVHNTINSRAINGLVIQGGTNEVTVHQPGRPTRGRTAALVAVLLVALTAVALRLTVFADGGPPGQPRVDARYALSLANPPSTTVVPASLTATDLPGDAAGCGGSRTWALGRNGMDVGRSEIDISAVGAKDRTVSVDGVRVELVGPPRAPETGTLLECQGQGEGDRIGMGIDMDSADRAPLVSAPDGLSYLPYFRTKYIYLEKQKPELIRLSVLAAEHSYDYVIVVEGTVDGERRSWTLKDGDRPFRISGIPAGPRTVLRSTVLGWSTYHSPRPVERAARCNPCHDTGGVVPGTAVPGAPEPKAPPSPPAPRPRPEQPPAFTVNRRDPESVAVAWALTGQTFDTSPAGRGPERAHLDSTAYLTGDLAASGSAEAAARSNGSVQPDELVRRQAWSVVDWVWARPDGDTPDPTGHLDDATVRLVLSAVSTYHDATGWSRESAGDGPRQWRLTLTRQTDGAYLISAVAPGKQA